MANSFAGIAIFGFQGVTYRLPVKLPQGVAVPANQVPPSVCPVTIDWNVYWQLALNPASVGVAVNLQAASVQASILDRIASVKIDNTGSGSPVYVQFPDTGDVVNCPANCSVTFPCLTNNLIANIYTTDLAPGFIPLTRIFFYNVVLPPAVDFEISQDVALYKASPSISRLGLTDQVYGAPSLGDQPDNSALALNGVGSTQQIFIRGGALPPSKFIIINAMLATVIYRGSNTPAADSVVSVDLISNISVNEIYRWNYNSIQSQKATLSLPGLTGVNIKLDGTTTYFIRQSNGSITDDIFFLQTVFTQTNIA